MLNVSLALMLVLVPDFTRRAWPSILVAAWAILATLSVWLPVVSACMPRSMHGNVDGGAATGIAGREDGHVAVFTAGAVAQAGGGSAGDGGDVYLAGRCRVDFYRAIYLVYSVFFRRYALACRRRFEGREPCQS